MKGLAQMGDNIMKRLLLSTAAVAAAISVVGAANAADIARPAPPPVKAPAYAPPPVYMWSGFYIGGNIGYGWTDGSGTVTSAGRTGPLSGDGDGVLGGAQIGYNWQTGPYVFGVETDFQGSGGSGHFNANLPGNRITGTAKTPWFGTIRGRLGYAVNHWLFYVTGGAAYAENKVSGTSSRFGAFSGSDVGWSYTVGGGVEAFVAPQWSVKAEYLYIGTPDKVPSFRNASVSGDTDTHVVRLGVNYHF
jgi:outer membrane immunogenic protein